MLQLPDVSALIYKPPFRELRRVCTWIDLLKRLSFQQIELFGVELEFFLDNLRTADFFSQLYLQFIEFSTFLRNLLVVIVDVSLGLALNNSITENIKLFSSFANFLLKNLYRAVNHFAF